MDTMDKLESAAHVAGFCDALGLHTPAQTRVILRSIILDAQEADGDYGDVRVAIAYAEGVRAYAIKERDMGRAALIDEIISA